MVIIMVFTTFMVLKHIQAQSWEDHLINPLLNAALAMNGVGRFEFRLVADDDTAVLTMDDTGPGIHNEDYWKGFKPFYSAMATTKRPGMFSQFAAS